MKTHEKIAELRRIKGATQKELADYVGVKVPCVSLWESGKRQISTEYLSKIATFFNLPIDFIFNNTDEEIEITQKLNTELLAIINNLSESETKELLSYLDYIISKRK